MADLIERLRDVSFEDCDEEPAIVLNTAHEAADALEALHRENERLREALGVIAYEQPEDAWCVAHDALKASAVPLAAQERGNG